MNDAELGSLLEKFSVFSIENSKNEEVQYEDQFRAMVGVLGNYFIGKRMFKTIQNLSNCTDSFIRPMDYIIYSDMIYHGTEEEKSRVSFLMLDIRGKGAIDLTHYKKFWEEFLFMYGELLSVKIEYNSEQTSQLTKETFY
jgi:hypothetical protein